MDTKKENKNEKSDDCKVDKKRKKNYAVQTDFREIECQTDPWDPDYTIPKETRNKQMALFKENQCNEPEVLILKNSVLNEKQKPS